jgi:hypothetical protein
MRRLPEASVNDQRPDSPGDRVAIASGVPPKWTPTPGRTDTPSGVLGQPRYDVYPFEGADPGLLDSILRDRSRRKALAEGVANETPSRLDPVAIGPEVPRPRLHAEPGERRPSGPSVGYHRARGGLPFGILGANERLVGWGRWAPL